MAVALVAAIDALGSWENIAIDFKNDETIEEALKMIEDAKRAWIEIPEPTPAADAYSEKFNLRIPRSLHNDLARKADEESVSFNT